MFFGAGKGLTVIPSPLAGQQTWCQAHRADFPLLLPPSLLSGSGQGTLPLPAWVPASLACTPARQRFSAIAKALLGPAFVRRKTSPSLSCKGCSESITPTEDTQEGGSPVSSAPQLGSGLRARKREAPRLSLLPSSRPAPAPSCSTCGVQALRSTTPAGGNRSAQISAQLSGGKAAPEPEERGAGGLPAPPSPPRGPHAAASGDAGGVPGVREPACSRRGSALLPVAGVEGERRGGSTLPGSAPTTRGWTPALILLPPARVLACYKQAHPLPPRRLIRGRLRIGTSRRVSRIPP